MMKIRLIAEEKHEGWPGVGWEWIKDNWKFTGKSIVIRELRKDLDRKKKVK